MSEQSLSEDETKLAMIKDLIQKEEATYLADYPWDKCIADQMAEYGDEETAKKICGAIKNRTIATSVIPKAKAILKKGYKKKRKEKNKK